jgi:hypothetical protein
MTRRLVTLASLAGALFFFAVILRSPSEAAVAAVGVAPPHLAADPGYRFDIRLGDRILQLRIRGCDTCSPAVTLEIKLPRLVDPARQMARFTAS